MVTVKDWLAHHVDECAGPQSNCCFLPLDDWGTTHAAEVLVAFHKERVERLKPFLYHLSECAVMKKGPIGRGSLPIWRDKGIFKGYEGDGKYCDCGLAARLAVEIG
jgi:hypothetical protein